MGVVAEVLPGSRDDLSRMRAVRSSVMRALRRQHFAVLSTADAEQVPHSAGVTYTVAPDAGLPIIYVMTRRHLQKARDIALNPRISIVVPVPRLLLRFVPPATIQLRGEAEILDRTDATATAAFGRFMIGRQILSAYRKSYERGERRICFLKITPEPIVRTYMLGSGIWSLRDRMDRGAATIDLGVRP